jgi:AAA15 family ATPase/GTPase
MLIGFSVKNFLSFYDETVFTMRANNDSKYKELNTIETQYGNLLKNAIFYGANSMCGI